MPFSHYSGLWKNIPHCLTQIQMGLAFAEACATETLGAYAGKPVFP